MSANTTGCCPRFNPDGRDGQALHFRDTPFVHAETRSAMRVPLTMGKVFSRVQEHLEEPGAFDEDDGIVLSHALSPWKAEHFLSAAKPVV